MPAEAAMDRSLCLCVCGRVVLKLEALFYTILNIGRVMQSPFFSIITQAKIHAHIWSEK